MHYSRDSQGSTLCRSVSVQFCNEEYFCMKRGIFTYAWDLEAEGYDTAFARLAGAGFTAVNLATAYHAGKFLMPRNPRSRTYFTEDGALYFWPAASRYGRLKPRTSRFATAESDPISRLITAAKPHGLDYVAWTVCLHNSWLGEQFPDVTQHTAFGDPLIHSLSPAHPDVHEYMLALLGDLCSRYDLAAIELESPGYMGYAHGYHHEINGVEFDPVQQRLLSISFNPTEVERAGADGIDAASLQRRIADLIDCAWNANEPVMVNDAPSADAQALFDDPELQAYQDWQQRQVVDLNVKMREVIHGANPDIEIRHFAALDVNASAGSAEESLFATGDALLTGYANSDEDASRRVETLRQFGKPVYGMVRAIAPDHLTQDSIASRIATFRDAGVDGIDVYNYGLMPQPNLDAVISALNE